LPPTSDLELMTAAAHPQPADVLRRQVQALYQGAWYWLLLSSALIFGLAAGTWPAATYTPALVGLALLCTAHGIGLMLTYRHLHRYQPPRRAQHWRKNLR